MFASPSFLGVAILVSSTWAVPLKRDEKDLSGTHTSEATYFTPDVGACNITNTKADHIAAVTMLVYDSFPGATPNNSNSNLNPICGEMIEATYKDPTTGREGSTKVAITDRCASTDTCNKEDLRYNIDLTETAFLELVGDLGPGRVHGVQWRFLGVKQDGSPSSATGGGTASGGTGGGDNGTTDQTQPAASSASSAAVPAPTVPVPATPLTDGSVTNPDGTITHPDGTVTNADGTPVTQAPPAKKRATSKAKRSKIKRVVRKRMVRLGRRIH